MIISQFLWVRRLRAAQLGRLGAGVSSAAGLGKDML